MAKVRIQPQYKPHPTKTVITGYLVYAWEVCSWTEEADKGR